MWGAVNVDMAEIVGTEEATEAVVALA